MFIYLFFIKYIYIIEYREVVKVSKFIFVYLRKYCMCLLCLICVLGVRDKIEGYRGEIFYCKF